LHTELDMDLKKMFAN